MEPGRTYHVALSVDVDRFSNAVLRKRWLHGLLLDGQPISDPQQLRDACATMRALGYEVFPPCDNTDSRGVCQGHPVVPVATPAEQETPS